MYAQSISPAVAAGSSAGQTLPQRRHRARPAAVAHLYGEGKRRAYRGKEVIYHQGESIDTVRLIRRGLVKLLSHLPNGRARIVRLHGEGHVLGLEGLLARPFEHTAVAVGDVELECVPLERLVRLERENPWALTGLLYQWHDALAQADRWIAEFSTGAIKSRVARLLQYLASIERGRAMGTVGLLTVGEIGEILGATPESVSRHLAAFKRRDILRRAAGSSSKTYRLDIEQVRREAHA